MKTVTVTIDLDQGTATLEEVIAQALAAGTVVLTRGDTPIARVVRLPVHEQIRPPVRSRADLFGTAKDLVIIPDNFDDPIEGMEEYDRPN